MFREGLFFPLTSWLLKPKVPWRTALASLRRRPDASARRETGDAGKRGEREGAAFGLERREPGVGGMVVHGRFCAKGNVCAEPIRWPWALSPLSWTLTVAASHSPFAFPPPRFSHSNSVFECACLYLTASRDAAGMSMSGWKRERRTFEISDWTWA